MKPSVERELLDILTGYLLKEKSIEDCASWFAALDWSEVLILGDLERLAYEAGKGLRPESDFWEEAVITVAGLLQPAKEEES